MSDDYTEAIRTSIAHASAEQLAHLADLAALAFGVITQAFQERFPAEYEAWEAREDLTPTAGEMRD